MLSGGSLTLCFPAGEVYPGKANILHAVFYYPAFDGMWTETGARATDNSRWKLIALTFDDGPSGWSRNEASGGSPWALRRIRAAGWHVTYYIWGKNILAEPSVLMSQADNGHSMQNHSMWHPKEEEINTKPTAHNQVARVDEAMLDVIGIQTTNFRAPFGAHEKWIALDVGMPIVQWNIDPKDPHAATETLIKRLTGSLFDGAIVLLHDTRDGTTHAIPGIGALLVEEGYMTVTVDELMSVYGVTMVPNTVYYGFKDKKASER